jgi:hypothetical protein
MSSMNKSCEKKQQHISQNILHVDVLYNIKRKKYKTVCAWLTEPERMYVNKHCVFHCSKSKTIHGGTPVQTIMYISITKGLCTLITHINYFFDHIVLLYLESRRCRYRSIIFACFTYILL